MNFSRCYINRGKVIYGFDPNIIIILYILYLLNTVKDISIIKRYMSYYSGYKREYFLGIVFAIIQIIITYMLPTITMNIFDKAIPDKSIRNLFVLLVIYAVLLISENICNIGYGYIFQKVNNKIAYKIRCDMIEHTGQVSGDFYSKSKTGDLMTKVTSDVDGVSSIFSDLFGEYPYDTCSVIASDFFIGGMEYPTLVMIDQTLYNEKDKFLLEYIIAHETAHQWWYSVVGNDEISEPWIDEALTEYSTVLYFEEKYGKEVASKLIKTMEMQTKNHSSENIFKPTTKYKNSIDYSLNVYTKGALAFNEVRNKVGDEVFFETLKEYYSTYMYKNVNGAKFVDLWNKKGVDIDKIISEYK